jgi:3-oxoacyl-[acyl-carrier protein] reductase
MIDLAGRSAVVTGGSRGIGRATASLLARAGADVAVTYHTRRGEAEDVVTEIRALGRRGFAVGGDLADPATARRLAAEVSREFGGLDFFVANAGIWPADEVPLARMAEGRWRVTMAANLDAVFHSTRAALGVMGPGGRVVIVSSTAGQRGEAGHADYAATKGAVIALTKSLAIECAPHILVNCVRPAGSTPRCARPPSPTGAGSGSPQASRSAGCRLRRTSRGRFCSSAAIWRATSPVRCST